MVATEKSRHLSPRTVGEFTSDSGRGKLAEMVSGKRSVKVPLSRVHGRPAQGFHVGQERLAGIQQLHRVSGSCEIGSVAVTGGCPLMVLPKNGDSM